jgi:hypothetical protein
MNIDNPKGTEPTVSAKTKVRRRFLKRATAGAVLTSLPAHSVWGAVCSVSGSMSGNLSGIQRHSDCDKPDLPAGRSPGTWKNLVLLNSAKIHAVFTSAPGQPGSGNGNGNSDGNGSGNGGGNGNADPVDNSIPNAEEIRNCYMQNVKEVAQASNMAISNDLINSSFETNIYDALVNPGGIDFNMAAVWLNVYFGLGLGATSIPAGASSANAVVEQLLSYIVVQNNNGVPVTLDDSFYNFVDGYTDMIQNNCHISPFTP